ncbi:hypothetical protein UNSWDHB_2136 [Dehalobacter sp. UNSWDHB]|nr:hypothetical protein DHBDCA_p404 [Dehalobacter sp. DCA]AFV04469.1 hypothetical protein DCF50_p463 [Dehalobacter sp. CF]EQB20587.1 hypothetical protein UNSWDHB_2136 [Dehalobacter sp. UNSWDHB]
MLIKKIQKIKVFRCQKKFLKKKGENKKQENLFYRSRK